MSFCFKRKTYLRWLKNHWRRYVSRGVISTRLWDDSTSSWLKISITCQNFEMAHFSRPKNLRWLKIRSMQYLEYIFFSNFEPSRSLRSEKVNHLWVLTRDRQFEPTRSWAISNSHAYDFTWNIPPSMTFWAILRYPPSRTKHCGLFRCLQVKMWEYLKVRTPVGNMLWN